MTELNKEYIHSAKMVAVFVSQFLEAAPVDETGNPRIGNLRIMPTAVEQLKGHISIVNG